MNDIYKDQRFDGAPEQQYIRINDDLNRSVSTLSESLRVLLKACYHQRFEQNHPTSILLENAQSEDERRVISIVAMLDLDSSALVHINNAEERHFIDTCHNYIRSHCRL
jgi:hypothetical protein